MPQFHSTPESLLGRTDSRDPATTCRGITSQGRPCRRSLASQTPSPASTPRKSDKQAGVPDLASLYCWQHQDQAVSPAPSGNPTISAKPNRKTSIDTLMDRLGVLEIKDEKPAPNARKPRPKQTFCCFTIAEDDEDRRPARPVQKPMQTRPSQSTRPSTQNSNQNVQRPQYGGVSPAPQTALQPPTPNIRQSSSSSQNKSLLSWIPPTLSPKTASVILTELAKPISDADEDGYIYMFWLTPQTTATRSATQDPLPRDIASSLLPSAPSGNSNLRPPSQPRSISDALNAARDLNALTSNPTSTTPGTLRLKIGRTNNVHRRMNEWTRQCSYDLTLIRYYPYTHESSSSTASSPATGLVPGRKVPHVHRVERLIHLELGEIRLRDLGKCSECGKEHREWFEVEAAKEALQRVDECVRRWVSWAESVK
ncbi:hypothetical protein N7540_007547 [Penicillium herquei]|nr:hypothetical protein N7540_007547 [Penicillium herquei]